MDKLIQMAVLASGSGMPPQVREQLTGMADTMASETDRVMRALGRVIHDILGGNTSPDLSGLPGEMADAVRVALDRFSN